MLLKTLIFILLSMEFLQAEILEKNLNGYDRLKDEIAPNYTAGMFLIYDCTEKHWTCVNEKYFIECQEKRKAELEIEKIHLSCAPIGPINNNKKSCFQRQLYMVGQNYGARACLNDKWKGRDISQK